MREKPKPQQIYRHFKGNLYQIITLATHSETGEACVVYQALYGDYAVYVRPLTMFLSEVDHEKYPEVIQKYRFQEVNAQTLLHQERVLAEAETKTETGIKSETETEEGLDPVLVEFLDAKNAEDKLRILTGLRLRINKEMLNIMAISLDLELKEAEVAQMYDELYECLLTKEKYERSRRY